MPSAVVNTVSAFTIREITGEQRTVRLVGRALPYRPYTLKTSQRVELTWYPGNPEATSSIFGASEAPTQIIGYWKDKYIQPFTDSEVSGFDVAPLQNQLVPITLNGNAVEDVKEAAEIIDSIVRQGQLIEVTWDETTRHGHLKDFEKNWHNIHDLEWSMGFEWISRGEPTMPSVFTTESSISDTSNLVTRQVSDLFTFALDIPFAADLTFQASLDVRLEAIANFSVDLEGSVTGLARQSITPQDAVRRSLATMSGLILELVALNNFIDATVPGSLNVELDLSAQSFGERLSATIYSRGVTKRSNDLKRLATLRRATLMSQLDTDLIGTYTAREGDDLRKVADIFYENSFEWQQLMVFNVLDTSVLQAGQIVLVPRRSGPRVQC